MTLLTPERVIQASRICRWRGRVSRHFSILEHSIIGAHVLREFDFEHNVVQAFLLHDLEETEFCGDIPTPDKALYMNERYFLDVAEWKFRLYEENGVRLHDDAVRAMDANMLQAEFQTVSLVPNDSPEFSRGISLAARLIKRGGYDSTAQFWKLWNGIAPRAFWSKEI